MEDVIRVAYQFDKDRYRKALEKRVSDYMETHTVAEYIRLIAEEACTKNDRVKAKTLLNRFPDHRRELVANSKICDCDKRMRDSARLYLNCVLPRPAEGPYWTKIPDHAIPKSGMVIVYERDGDTEAIVYETRAIKRLSQKVYIDKDYPEAWH